MRPPQDPKIDRARREKPAGKWKGWRPSKAFWEASNLCPGNSLTECQLAIVRDDPRPAYPPNSSRRTPRPWTGLHDARAEGLGHAINSICTAGPRQQQDGRPRDETEEEGAPDQEWASLFFRGRRRGGNDVSGVETFDEWDSGRRSAARGPNMKNLPKRHLGDRANIQKIGICNEIFHNLETGDWTR